MDVDALVRWAFEAVLAGCAVYVAQVLSQLKASVDELNTQMSTILERDRWHQSWLERHDDEIHEIRKAQ
jgi:hypothetical protein